MSKPSMHILIVEENVDQLKLSIDALKKNDPTVEINSAENGTAALAMLGTLPFDLLILGFKLPGMTGLEVLQQMKEMELKVPVMMVTRYGDETVAVAAMKAGALDYIVKTEHYFEDLVLAVDKTIEESQASRDREEVHLKTRCLYEILLSVTKEQKVEDMSGRLVKGVCELIGVVKGVVVLINNEESNVVFSKTHGFQLEEDAFLGPVASLGCLSDSYYGQNPVVIDEPHTHPKWGLTPWLHPFMRDLLSVPLAMKGEVSGLLIVMNKAKHRPFTTEDINLLSTVAVHAGVAFDNATFLKNMEKQAISDSLTGLYNHLEFQKRLAEELERTRRYAKHFSLLMLDIDHFKGVNDSFGHQAGDTILKEVSGIIKMCVRTCDLVFRYGGEEFAVILPETALNEAKITAERIRTEISRNPIKIDERSRSRVTVSIGVSSFPKDADRREDLISAADQALYAAKRSGRDAVALYGEVLKKVSEKNPIELDEYLSDPEMKTLRDIASVIDAKNPYMSGHTEGVLRYAMSFANVLKMGESDKKNLEFASLLHNIGKVSLPSKLLNKQGPLTEKEREVINTHPGIAQLLIKQSEQFQQVLPAILYHHERYDGKGYPNGLKGEEIPLLARILSIVDSYFAMISARSYRPKMSKEQAIEELRKNAGTQFDPEMAEVFIKLLECEDLPS